VPLEAVWLAADVRESLLGAASRLVELDRQVAAPARGVIALAAQLLRDAIR